MGAGGVSHVVRSGNEGGGGKRKGRERGGGEKRREKGGGRGERADLYVACLGNLTIHHACLSRRSTVPTKKQETPPTTLGRERARETEGEVYLQQLAYCRQYTAVEAKPWY